MRGHGFVEGQGRGVAGTGDDAHDPRTQRTAPTGVFVGVLKRIDADVDEASGAEPRGEHTGRDDDAHHVGVALTHAVEELLGEFLRIAAADGQGADRTDHHSLSHAHLDCGHPEVAADEDGDGNEHHERLQNGRREVILLLQLAFVNLSVRVTLVVTQNEADKEHAHDEDRTAHQRIGGVEADEVHHFHVGHLRHVRVVRRTGREIGTDRTGQHRRCGSSRLNAGAEHHGNQSRTHGRGAARSRRNGDVHEERDHRADGDEENAQTAHRRSQIMNERTVALRVACGKSKAHRRADCHHERVVRHGLGELIERSHGIQTDAAEQQACADQHETRFITFNECPDRHNNDGKSNPCGKGHTSSGDEVSIFMLSLQWGNIEVRPRAAGFCHPQHRRLSLVRYAFRQHLLR